MAARLARWEESRRRNALRQQRQPQHVTTDVGRHDLFAQPQKQSSHIKDPFARPPLQLEPTDEQLGQPRLRRPEIKVSAPPGGETSWAIADAGAPEGPGTKEARKPRRAKPPSSNLEASTS